MIWSKCFTIYDLLLPLGAPRVCKWLSTGSLQPFGAAQVGSALSTLCLNDLLIAPSYLGKASNDEASSDSTDAEVSAAFFDGHHPLQAGEVVEHTNAAEPADIEMGIEQPAEAESSRPFTTPEGRLQAFTDAQAPQQRATSRQAGLDGAQPSTSGHSADPLPAGPEGQVISLTLQQLTAAQALSATSSVDALASAQHEKHPAHDERLAGGQSGSSQVKDSANASSAQEQKREEAQGRGEASSRPKGSASAEGPSIIEQSREETLKAIGLPPKPGTWAAIVGDSFQLLLQLSALMQPAKAGELPQDKHARDQVV